MRELEVLQKFSHPNIVQLFGIEKEVGSSQEKYSGTPGIVLTLSLLSVLGVDKHLSFWASFSWVEFKTVVHVHNYKQEINLFLIASVFL